MSAVGEAWAALNAALKAVDGVRVYEDLGTTFDPPALVVMPPELSWDGYLSAPTEATFTVVLAVRADERAMQRLWDLAPAVAVAIDQVQDAVVKRAIPGTTPSGSGSPLPAYLFEVECAL
ncbi:hypothetical protein [Pseudonocardia pini]|uniref:hypothetical protein n=1 Tax=Pseudonocardia pini TaxID=2758030 RepID=UPI0015EFE67D|nr:hypothetical protein [Pseudonocardia pini]